MSDSELSGPEFTGEPALTAAPWEVKLSFALWLAEAVLGILSGLFVVFAGALVPAVVGVESAEAAAFVGATIAVGAAVALLAVFRLICSVFLLRGRPWARNALTILGVLGLIGVIGEFQGNPAVAIAHGLVLVVALVTMFLPNANAYLRRPFPAS